MRQYLSSLLFLGTISHLIGVRVFFVFWVVFWRGWVDQVLLSPSGLEFWFGNLFITDCQFDVILILSSGLGLAHVEGQYMV